MINESLQRGAHKDLSLRLHHLDDDLSTLSGDVVVIKNKPRVRQIADHGSWLDYGLSDGTVTEMTYKFPYVAMADCYDIQLVFGNYTLPSPTDTPNPDDIKVKTAIELSDGTIIPSKFNGETKVPVQGNASIESDIVPIDLVKGELFWVRTHVSVDTLGKKWPLGLVALSTRGGGSYAGDYSYSGTITAATVYAYHPTNVVGKSNTPAVLMVGDSIAYGGFDNNGVNNGYLRRAINPVLPWSTIARSSDAYYLFNAILNRQCRMNMIKYHTSAIVHMGINDIRVNVTDAQMVDREQVLWKILANRGLDVFACTMLPNSTSSDVWATDANQAIYNVNQNKVRIQHNERVRQVVSPLTGYFETADRVETQRNSGLWAPNTTGDGLHPNATGYSLIVPAIDTTKFK